MTNLFTHEFLSPAAWHLAGWTMLHFLWVGALLGIVAAVLRLALRTAPANVRYATMLTLLFAIAIAPPAIAWWLVQSDALPDFVSKPAHQPTVAFAPQLPDGAISENGATREIHVDASENPPPLTPPPQAGEGVFPLAKSPAFAWLDHCVAIMPWIWLIGSPLVFAWLALGLTGAERLRRGSTVIDDGPLYQACTRMVQELRIRGRVTLAVCERIASPVLVGIVRPMILVPPAALTGWSPDEIEMVLLHELAHVRRWDNLVNLGQRIVEACLFFHPVVWLVSGWVRQEREACCDALVVAHTAQPQAYAELLVNLAVSRSPLAGVALARHPLAQRIRNILKLEDPPMAVSRKTLALFAVLLMATVSAFVLYAPVQGEPAADRSRLGENEIQAPDSNSFDDAGKRLDEAGQRLGDAASSLDDLELPKTSPTRASRPANPDSPPAFPFPTLEEQKKADVAVKMLGLELGKIGEEDIKRAKKLGFNGGLKVTHGRRRGDGSQSRGGGRREIESGVADNDIRFGDLLVGLHVWPTRNLNDVGTVLERADLGELSPLKFYVVRKEVVRQAGMGGYGGMEGGYGMEAPQKFEDTVITGRIEVMNVPKPMFGKNSYSVPAPSGSMGRSRAATVQPTPVAQSQNSPQRFVTPTSPTPSLYEPRPILPPSSPYAPSSQKPTRQPAPVLYAPTPAKPTLLFDGKTFDQWRDQWQGELKTEKRIEAINALAAFGREGMGKEVAKAILDVAGNYDFSMWVSGTLEQELKETILSVLAGSMHTDMPASVPTQAWLPLLLERLSQEPEKWEDLTVALFNRLDINVRGRQALIEPLTEHERPKVRKAAKNLLKQLESTESEDAP